MALLSSSDYPAIRALIDTALTAEELPDAVIGYDQVVGYADRLVKTFVPTAEALTGDNLLRAKLAARLIAAAQLALGSPEIKNLIIGPYSETRQERDWTSLSKALMLKADKEIQKLL